jgi:hypothetical protein
MYDTHLVVVEHHSFEVPFDIVSRAVTGRKRERWTVKTHKLDCDLLVVQQICSLEQDTERTLANLLSYTIMHTHDVGRRRGHGSGDRQEPACRLQSGDNEMDWWVVEQ